MIMHTWRCSAHVEMQTQQVRANLEAFNVNAFSVDAAVTSETVPDPAPIVMVTAPEADKDVIPTPCAVVAPEASNVIVLNEFKLEALKSPCNPVVMETPEADI